jgi:hypothetical protein
MRLLSPSNAGISMKLFPKLALSLNYNLIILNMLFLDEKNIILIAPLDSLHFSQHSDQLDSPQLES